MKDHRMNTGRLTLPALIVCLLPMALVAEQDKGQLRAEPAPEISKLPREELRYLEVDRRGNIIVRGQAELVILYNDVEDSAVYADLAAHLHPEPIDERFANEVGSRCAASVRALALRELHGDGATVICMPDSKLYDALQR